MTTARMKRVPTPVVPATVLMADFTDEKSEGESFFVPYWVQEAIMSAALAAKRAEKENRAYWAGHPSATVPSPVYWWYVTARALILRCLCGR